MLDAILDNFDEVTAPTTSAPHAVSALRLRAARARAAECLRPRRVSPRRSLEGTHRHVVPEPDRERSEQANAVAEGDKPIFYETVDACTTRTSYVVVMDRLSVSTDRAMGDDWNRIFEGTYRRR
jgi:hypothetical protein